MNKIPKTPKAPITEADLQAYVDGHLDALRHAEVKAWLTTHPSAMARVRAFQEQNAALRKLFAPVLQEPIPIHLLRPASRKPFIANWSRLAVILPTLCMGGILGWFGRETFPGAVSLVQVAEKETPAMIMTVAESGFARRAAVAHAVYSPDIRRPVEIAADQEAQLVAWLSNRLGITLKPPALGTLGYELIGGRLLPGEQGAVAQFMYHDAAGKRLTLYISREKTDAAETGFQFVEEGPIGVFFWLNQGMGYAISAGADKAELAQVALAVYGQLKQ